MLTTSNRYQSRAFLLFPMCFNIGVIIGPVLGGILADPAGSYPSVFGHIVWLKKFPYAPPNILSAFFLFCASLGVFFGLSEVCFCVPQPFAYPNIARRLNPSAIKKIWEPKSSERSKKYSLDAKPRIHHMHTLRSQAKNRPMTRWRRMSKCLQSRP